MKEKTAAEMTVDDFTAWLKMRRAQMLKVEDRLPVGQDRNQRLPKMTPLMAMHTRRAMQRRRGK
jgi:hypothetical protein